MGVNVGDKVGGFELEKKLGIGGMATIWLARATALKPARRVVLKLMHDHLAETREIRDLFVEEARLAQRLEHANVVKVLDLGVERGRCFIAMEHVDGVDLRSATVAHEGPLKNPVAVSLIADALKGLAYAHRRGVVHRDVSPDNVMVDVEGRVRLMDFGIARAESTELTTKTGLRKGKVRYMAPEYLADHVANPATDVYSMGLTLHELVTGHPPFGDAAPAAMFFAIANKGVPRADTLRPSMPQTLVRTLERATARAPKDRFATAAEFEAALRDFLREYPPPTAKELGREVTVWLKKLEGGPLRQKPRGGGTLGQLETTEFVKLQDLSEQVTGPLPTADSTDWEVDTDPQKAAPLPSVMLDPELEAVAVRQHSTGPKKKKKPRARK